METYNMIEFEKAGLKVKFVHNESKSKKGVLRGVCISSIRNPQGKLVRAIKGKIFDVAVDLRKGSPTYMGNGKLSYYPRRTKKQFHILEGFVHGFLALSNHAIVDYKSTEFYYPEYEGGIRWDDPTISIKWPLNQ